jgi:hypothetical protein
MHEPLRTVSVAEATTIPSDVRTTVDLRSARILSALGLRGPEGLVLVAPVPRRGYHRTPSPPG